MTTRKLLLQNSGHLENHQTGDNVDLANRSLIALRELLWDQDLDNGNLGDTFVPDWTQGNNQRGTFSDNCSIFINSLPGPGIYKLLLKQNGNNAFIIIWGGSLYDSSRWIGISHEPQVNLQQNGETLITFVYDGTFMYQEIEYVSQASGLNIGAYNQTAFSNTIALVNSGGITWGLSGSQITASGSSAIHSFGASNLGNLIGITGVATGSNIQFLLDGGNNVTLSQSIDALSTSGSVTISVLALSLGATNLGNTVGTTSGGMVSGQFVLVGGNNITLSESLNGQSATITISNSNLPPTLSGFDPFPLFLQNTQTGWGSFGTTFGQPIFMPFMLPNGLTISNLFFPVSISTFTSTDTQQYNQTLGYGIYTRNATNSTRLDAVTTSNATWEVSYNSTAAFGYSWMGTNSTSAGSIVATQLSGIKLLALPFVTSLSAGEYWLALNNSAIQTPGGIGTGPIRLSYLTQLNLTFSFGRIGIGTNKSIMPKMSAFGVSSVGGVAFPSTVAFSDIQWSSGQQVPLHFANYGIS